MADFNLLAKVFIYDDPSKHFSPLLSFEVKIKFMKIKLNLFNQPFIDFKELEQNEVLTIEQKEK